MKSSSLVLIAETAYAAGTVTITGTRQKVLAIIMVKAMDKTYVLLQTTFPE